MPLSCVFQLEDAPTELAEDIVLEALFKGPIKPQPEPRVRTKRHRSTLTTETGYEARVIKRECTELDHARRSCLVDQEIRHRITLEMDVKESSSMYDITTQVNRTSDGFLLRDVGTTDGGQVDDRVGSGKMDPPPC